MKKGLFFLFVTICFCSTVIFTGCNIEKEVAIKKFFSSNIYISTENINFTGTFVHKKNGNITLNINSPEEIKDYRYELHYNMVSMSFMDIKSEYKIDTFPKEAPVRILYNVFSSLDEEEGVVKNYNVDKENNYIVTLKEGQIAVNKQGKIKSITKDNVKITFSNIKSIK